MSTPKGDLEVIVFLAELLHKALRIIIKQDKEIAKLKKKPRKSGAKS